MKITSPVFEHNSSIPAKYTCEGSDINPPLLIQDIPGEAKELALIVEDPDAPAGLWIHWVVYNIPITGSIEENSIPGTQGNNTLSQPSYHGPCPPSGTHRYFFKIYALDEKLNLRASLSKGALEKAMQGHIIDQAELVGLYKKSGNK